MRLVGRSRKRRETNSAKVISRTAQTDKPVGIHWYAFLGYRHVVGIVPTCMLKLKAVRCRSAVMLTPRDPERVTFLRL